VLLGGYTLTQRTHRHAGAREHGRHRAQHLSKGARRSWSWGLVGSTGGRAGSKVGERATTRPHLAVEVDVELRGRFLLVVVQREDLQPRWVSAQGLAPPAIAAGGMLLRGSGGGSAARGCDAVGRRAWRSGAHWASGEPAHLAVRLHPIALPQCQAPAPHLEHDVWWACAQIAPAAHELWNQKFVASDRAGRQSHIVGRRWPTKGKGGAA